MSDGATPAAADPDGRGHVTVVGTAHVSHDSVAEVERTIEETDPDVVAVELDEGRFRQLQGEAPEDMEPSDLLGGNTVFQFLAYWMLSYVQARLGDQFDIQPGADMMAAVETAEAMGVDVALVDRDIQVTVQRFWARMTLVEKIQMVAGLALAFVTPLELGVLVGASLGLVAGILVKFALAGALGVGPAGISATLSSATLVLLGGLVAGGVVGGVATALFNREVGALMGAFGLPARFEHRTAALVGFGLAGGGAVGLAGGADIGVVAVSAELLAGLGTGAISWLASIGVGVGAGLAAGTALGLGLAAVADPEEYEEVDVADLTDGDVVTAMLEEFRRFSPGGAEALIDERDAFIGHQLVALREHGQDVVAVVGAGHRAGIERYLEAPGALPGMETLTGTAESRGFPWSKVIGYGVTVVFLSFFLLLAMAGVRDGFLLRLFGAWFLVNGVFAAGLAKVAGARWRSAGVGGLVAWMTSINPLLAPGWFTGYVELRHEPVNIGDISTLNELLSDETRPLREVVADMFEVPLFKLIVVVAMTNVGSVVASALFGFVILPAMGAEIGGVSAIPGLMMEGARESARLVWRVVA
ncbi:MAG: TraB/GumN family protein [Halobacteriales archaeon]